MRADDAVAVVTLARRQFALLPQPLAVSVEGGDVLLKFPEESKAAQQEAARLAVKAGERAREGKYVKAVAIFKRVLELQPSLHAARRDMAMLLMETRDIDVQSLRARAVLSDGLGRRVP